MLGPLGFPEMLFILAVALLIFGPKRLPEVGRKIGRAMGEFRSASNELKRTLNAEIALEEDIEETTRAPTIVQPAAQPTAARPRVEAVEEPSGPLPAEQDSAESPPDER